jgi:coproporphyrinogen III oxidase
MDDYSTGGPLIPLTQDLGRAFCQPISRLLRRRNAQWSDADKDAQLLVHRLYHGI